MYFKKMSSWDQVETYKGIVLYFFRFYALRILFFLNVLFIILILHNYFFISVYIWLGKYKVF